MKLPEPSFVHDGSIYNSRAAETVIPLLLQTVQPNSVLDVGCGTGTWLKIFENYGVKECVGIEEPHIDTSKLIISEERIILHNLNFPLNLGRNFDLVVSLEVAEHLSESTADTFVETLISHSKTILFSAAIPEQGGQNHLNEQWPHYWQEKFRKYGYYYHDTIRPQIWNNEKVDIWYRQNIFLVVHESLKTGLPEFTGNNQVHPELWLLNVQGFKYGMKHCEEELDRWKNGKAGLRSYLNGLKFAAKKKIFTFSWNKQPKSY